MKGFQLVIQGFGNEESVQELMDAINGTIPVDEKKVVIARQTAVVGAMYVDIKSDEQVGEELFEAND